MDKEVLDALIEANKKIGEALDRLARAQRDAFDRAALAFYEGAHPMSENPYNGIPLFKK